MERKKISFVAENVTSLSIINHNDDKLLLLIFINRHKSNINPGSSGC